MSNLYYFLKRMENVDAITAPPTTTTSTTTTSTTTTSTTAPPTTTTSTTTTSTTAPPTTAPPTTAPPIVYDANCGDVYSDPGNTTYTVYLGTGAGEVVVIAASCTIWYRYNGINYYGNYIDVFIRYSSPQMLHFSKIDGVNSVEINVRNDGGYYSVIVNCPTTLRETNCNTRITGTHTETVIVNLGSGTGKVFFYPNEISHVRLPHCILEYNGKVVCYSNNNSADNSVLSFDKVNVEPEKVYVSFVTGGGGEPWDFTVSCPVSSSHLYEVNCGVQYTTSYYTKIDSLYSPGYHEELWKPRFSSKMLFGNGTVKFEIASPQIAISSGTRLILTNPDGLVVLDVVGPALLRYPYSAAYSLPPIYDTEFYTHFPLWSLGIYITLFDLDIDYLYTITCGNAPAVDLSTTTTTTTAPPIEISGTSVGFYIGGYITVSGIYLNSVKMLNFSTEVAVLLSAVLQIAKLWIGAANSFSTKKSYIGGGYTSNADGNYSSTIDVLDASTVTSATSLVVLSGRLNEAKAYVSTVYSDYAGYFVGGSAGASYCTGLNSVNFSNETVQSVGTGATLQVAVVWMCNASCSTFGYIIGGKQFDGTVVSYVQKLDYSTLLTNTSVVSSLSTPKYYSSSAHNIYYAFVIGGKSTTNIVSTIEAISFTNDSVAVQIMNTEALRNRCTTTFSSDAAYTAGGLYTYGDASVIEKLIFNTVTTSTYSITLSAATHYGSVGAGASNLI